MPLVVCAAVVAMWLWLGSRRFDDRVTTRFRFDGRIWLVKRCELHGFNCSDRGKRRQFDDRYSLGRIPLGQFPAAVGANTPSVGCIGVDAPQRATGAADVDRHDY